MVVQNSTRTMVVEKNNKQGAPYAYFSRNRASMKKCGYHNVMFAVVLVSNIISGSVTT